MSAASSIRLTVDADDDARRSGAVDAVIASLPVSFAHASTEATADVVAIAGTAGWPGRALVALDHGARGLVIVEPSDADPAAVSALGEAAEALGAVVVVDRAFAGTPAATLSAAALGDATTAGDAPVGVVESRVSSPASTDHDTGFGDTVLAQLAFTRAVAAPVASATTLVRSRSGYTITGALTTGHRVLLTSTATDAQPAHAALRLVGADGAVELTVPNPAAARPATLTVTTPSAAGLAPTLYETAHRAAWRRVHALVTAAEPGTRSGDLEALAADIALARSLG